MEETWGVEEYRIGPRAFGNVEFSNFLLADGSSILINDSRGCE